MTKEGQNRIAVADDKPPHPAFLTADRCNHIGANQIAYICQHRSDKKSITSWNDVILLFAPIFFVHQLTLSLEEVDG